MTRKIVFVIIMVFFGVLKPRPAEAQILDIISIINTAIKKVIVAADLEVERLQNQTIALQDAQKQLENTMQSSELGAITNWAQQQKDLFTGFYQELLQVKNALVTYNRVKGIIERQISIVSSSQQISAVIGQDNHFSATELNYLKTVLTGIVTQSISNLKQLDLVINAFVTQMDDADRLRIIDQAGDAIDKNQTDLKQFSHQTELLSLQRAKDANDIAVTKALYGID